MATEQALDTVETATVTLIDGMHFKGQVDTFHLDLDASAAAGGNGNGPQPLRLFLLGVAGCTAMDVISILRKKRQHISAFTVDVQAERTTEHPKVYTALEIMYRITGAGVDPQAVERAIELSETRYCPAIAMLGEAVKISSRYEIAEDSVTS